MVWSIIVIVGGIVSIVYSEIQLSKLKKLFKELDETEKYRKKTEAGMSSTSSRIMDYQKIIHICQERIRQLQSEDSWEKYE